MSEPQSRWIARAEISYASGYLRGLARAPRNGLDHQDRDQLMIASAVLWWVGTEFLKASDDAIETKLPT